MFEPRGNPTSPCSGKAPKDREVRGREKDREERERDRQGGEGERLTGREFRDRERER